MDYNRFRQIDAFEYTDAYRRAIKKDPKIICKWLETLNTRMEKVGYLSYLLAGYRGYEDALCFKECGLRSNTEQIVILDQSTGV
jgi:hypothetical protein